MRLRTAGEISPSDCFNTRQENLVANENFRLENIIKDEA
jgi:hypothetical protein